MLLTDEVEKHFREGRIGAKLNNDRFQIRGFCNMTRPSHARDPEQVPRMCNSPRM